MTSQGRTVRFPGLTLSWFTAMVGPFAAAALMAPAAMDGEETANLQVSGSAIRRGPVSVRLWATRLWALQRRFCKGSDSGLQLG